MFDDTLIFWLCDASFIHFFTAPPSFTRAPKNQTALDGETVTLECVAAGYPPPTIAWHKDGGRLPSDGRHFVLPSGTLRILFVKEENEGTYECQAINVIGVNVTKATLTVNDRGWLIYCTLVQSRS